MDLGEVGAIALRSLAVSGLATAMAASWSIPAALYLVYRPGRVREAVIGLCNAMVGVPTVLVGLLLYMLLSSSGPLGFTGLLYTPAAISIGQAVLITPLTVSLSCEVLREARATVWELAMAMGASRFQAAAATVSEYGDRLAAAVLVSFGRAIGELGVALMLGGNIKGLTRVFTTAIALEVQRGEFEEAIALGMILLAIVAAIAVSARALGWRR